MKFTGENFVPGITKKRLISEHINRYDYACEYAQNKIVLDIACGTGYGSDILRKKAKKVFGVDISAKSIDYAKKKFKHNNLEFIKASATDEHLFSENSFDFVCSFETIEHFDYDSRRKYLMNLRKWLKPNGYILFSTPNKIITSPYTHKPLNKFHKLEFTKDKLNSELKEFFVIKKIMGQRLVPKIFTKFFIRKFISLIQRIIQKDFGIYTTRSSSKVKSYNKNKFEPRIFVVLCQNKQ